MARANKKTLRRISKLIADANRAAKQRDFRYASSLSEQAEELCHKLGLTPLLEGLDR